MMSFGLIADVVLIVLLGATLFYVVKLSRRLAQLREDRQSFETLVKEFANATAEAGRGLAELRQGADGVARELAGRMERAQGVVGELQRSADDLKMLINRADIAANKLEQGIDQSRQQRPDPARQAEAAPRAPSDEDGAQVPDAQTRALLSALGRIR
ncbi:MAG: hypothetical protein JNL25_07385 [Rhodospirillaceae bacterium]|nr:hypothetical protein [Rhodospirillaceae bacterium]